MAVQIKFFDKPTPSQKSSLEFFNVVMYYIHSYMVHLNYTESNFLYTASEKCNSEKMKDPDEAELFESLMDKIDDFIKRFALSDKCKLSVGCGVAMKLFNQCKYVLVDINCYAVQHLYPLPEELLLACQAHDRLDNVMKSLPKVKRGMVKVEKRRLKKHIDELADLHKKIIARDAVKPFEKLEMELKALDTEPLISDLVYQYIEKELYPLNN